MFLSGKSARKNTQANAPSALNLLLFGSHFYLKRFFKKTNKKNLQHHSLRHFADGAHSLLNIKKKNTHLLSYTAGKQDTYFLHFFFILDVVLFPFCLGHQHWKYQPRVNSFFCDCIYSIKIFFKKQKHGPMTHEIQMGAGSGEK